MKTVLHLSTYFVAVMLSMISLSLSFGKNSHEDLLSLRKAYISAVESESITDSLLSYLQKQSTKTPTLLAYQGACEGLKAKHVFNPYKKLDYLNKSQQTLAKAIALDPTNIELRFLRFSMQHYLPAFLGHSKNLEEDRKTILMYLEDEKSKSLGIPTLIIISNFLIDCKRCSPDELLKVKAFLQILS
jgi:DNA mismatch repair ATPase MutS